MRISRFLAILAVSSALAGYASWVMAERERERQALPASSGAIPLLRRDDAEALWRSGTAVFLDVRSQADYEQGHIAGALHFPEEEIEQRLPAVKPRLERASALVVYCGSENCGKSLWAAIRLRHEGLTQVRIYPAGWNEWHRHGLPSSEGGAP